MSTYIIFWTSILIFGIALLAAFAWLFDDDDLPKKKKHNDQDDYNDRTG
jgi:hypothetical protein